MITLQNNIAIEELNMLLTYKECMNSYRGWENDYEKDKSVFS